MCKLIVGLSHLKHWRAAAARSETQNRRDFHLIRCTLTCYRRSDNQTGSSDAMLAMVLACLRNCCFEVASGSCSSESLACSRRRRRRKRIRSMMQLTKSSARVPSIPNGIRHKTLSDILMGTATNAIEVTIHHPPPAIWMAVCMSHKDASFTTSGITGDHQGVPSELKSATFVHLGKFHVPCHVHVDRAPKQSTSAYPWRPLRVSGHHIYIWSIHRSRCRGTLRRLRIGMPRCQVGRRGQLFWHLRVTQEPIYVAHELLEIWRAALLIARVFVWVQDQLNFTLTLSKTSFRHR